MPCIEDLLDELGQAQFNSMLYLMKDYWQVPVAENSRHKIAFVIPLGKYQFQVMPFGLVGPPAVFQKLMNTLLAASPNMQQPTWMTWWFSVSPHQGLSVVHSKERCGYYRHFILDFSTTAASFSDLIKKDVPDHVKWGETKQKAFNQLKSRLASGAVLWGPDFRYQVVLSSTG